MASKYYNNDQSALVASLLERDHSSAATKTEACEQLGERVGVTGNTIMHLAGGGHCGQATQKALERIWKKPKIRKRILAYVPCPDEETRDLIHKHLSADERYLSLAMLAEHEED